jgi:glycosyltransferase involved in cell wall biosynthesis
MFEADKIPVNWVRASAAMDLTIVPTQFCKDVWIKCGVSEKKIAVLPLGVDPFLYKPDLPSLPLLDHNEEEELVTKYPIRFLTVQEVITRKNLEGLLKAWCEETTPDDKACLLLKVGSHSGDKLANFVKQYVEELKKKKVCAPVYALTALMDEKLMPHLYATCTHYITASCGEGWGFPESKAGVMGKLLIAPRHTSFLDYLSDDVSYLVDCDKEPAKQRGATFRLYEGANWYRPRLDSLKAKIRESINDFHAKNLTKGILLRELISSKFDLDAFGSGLDDILQNLTESVGSSVSVPAIPKRPLNFCVVCKSLGTKCGIADHTSSLYTAMRTQHTLGSCMAIGGKDVNYLNVLDQNSLQVVNLHIEYQFHSSQRLEFLFRQLKTRGIKSVVTMHTATRTAPLHNSAILRGADKVVVGTESMKRELIDWCGGHQFASKIEVIPLGMDDTDLRVCQANSNGYQLKGIQSLPIYLVGFFGFAYFHKGIDKLLLSARIVNQVGLPYRLRLKILANKPPQDSQNYFEHCFKMLNMLGLENDVEWQSAFLDEKVALTELSKCHAIALPYSEYGGKAASAAVRFALKAGVPLITSDACFFDDVPDELATKVNPDDLSTALITHMKDLPNHSTSVINFVQARDKFLSENSFNKIGVRYLKLFQEIVDNG